LAVAAIVCGLGFGTMFFIDSALSLAIVGLIGAATYAPLLIVANTVCERAVPQRRLTEAITWLNAGFTCGCAIGPSLGGAVIDSLGTLASFKVGSGLALGLAVTGLLTYRVVKKHLGAATCTVVEERKLGQS
jgi:Major Facilitator Superfamily.